tara:strand:+ start:1591 stop:2808 length:1218 start_codon:yes stop_codon:yes gene_type:complete
MIDKHPVANDDLDGSLEESIANKLVDHYDQVTSRSYLASSTKLLETTGKNLTAQQTEAIFKSKAKYYSGLRSVETGLKHIHIYISPSLARDMLQFSRRGVVNTNNKNRRLSKTKIKKYAEAMKKGEWCLTGEPVIISHEGEILNGHHRLEAACEAQVGFIATVTYDVIDERSFANIDVGNTRSRAQVLEMAGVKVNAASLSRVAMLAKAFESTSNPFAFRGTQGTSFQPEEILKYVEQNHELALSVDFVSKVLKRNKQESQASEPIYAFAHYLIKLKLQESQFEHLPITPELYLTRLISSIGLESEDDVEYQVRKYLQSLVHESTSYSLLCRLSSIFKGWNTYLNIPIVGNKVSVKRVARYKKDEDGNKFPLPGAGNINEAFTIPCIAKGATPKRIQDQANIQMM